MSEMTDAEVRAEFEKWVAAYKVDPKREPDSPYYATEIPLAVALEAYIAGRRAGVKHGMERAAGIADEYGMLIHKTGTNTADLAADAIRKAIP